MKIGKITLSSLTYKETKQSPSGWLLCEYILYTVHFVVVWDLGHLKLCPDSFQSKSATPTDILRPGTVAEQPHLDPGSSSGDTAVQFQSSKWFLGLCKSSCNGNRAISCSGKNTVGDFCQISAPHPPHISCCFYTVNDQTKAKLQKKVYSLQHFYLILSWWCCPNHYYCAAAADINVNMSTDVRAEGVFEASGGVSWLWCLKGLPESSGSAVWRLQGRAAGSRGPSLIERAYCRL